MNQVTQSTKLPYILQQADNCLILGQRLSEWCGHGPILEQDIALTNIALDLIGQSRMFYQYAAEVQGEGKTEDDLVAFRDAWDYRNVLLVEQPNGDFAKTILRQFLFDTFNCFFYEELTRSNDDRLRAIAEKSHKETLYHIKWSGDWVIRLGDGTEESKKRMQEAIDDLWSYSKETTTPSGADEYALTQGFGTDLVKIKNKQDQRVHEVFHEATLEIPENVYQHLGGKEGRHTEHLGYLLADLQFLQRAYPGNEW